MPYATILNVLLRRYDGFLSFIILFHNTLLSFNGKS